MPLTFSYIENLLFPLSAAIFDVFRKNGPSAADGHVFRVFMRKFISAGPGVNDFQDVNIYGF